MNAKPMFLTLGLYLLAMTLAASAPKASWFEAHATGAKTLALQGAAEFGPGAGTPAEAPFVLTLGAESPTGAVVFTRPNGRRPGPGVYPLDADGPATIHALVVTGSPTHPTGAFQARRGTLTITRSREDHLEGRFDIDAVGFEATTPDDEGRELVVRGAFTASSSARPAR